MEKELILGILQSFKLPAIATLLTWIIYKSRNIPFFKEVLDEMYRRFMK